MNENLDPSSNNLSLEEREFENNLRPSSFDEFSGQDLVINFLKIFVQASNQRGDALDHTLNEGGKSLLIHECTITMQKQKRARRSKNAAKKVNNRFTVLLDGELFGPFEQICVKPMLLNHTYKYVSFVSYWFTNIYFQIFVSELLSKYHFNSIQKSIFILEK